MRCLLAVFLLLIASAVSAIPVFAGDGNRLAFLDENNPWYPHLNFPKLITPQWVGEEGVECVVVLAIDDMRDPAKYEAYLRPILNRLKQIDGRAPVSIMTCNVKPNDQHLKQWLDEGLSLEVHTVDHPCPLLCDGDFAKAKSTYDRCVDLLNQVPGDKPVAFRMPCCDSLNTVSPRFYSEIFGKKTPAGNALAVSSSVFNIFTSDDPVIPRELVQDADGRDKFLKYIPKNLKRGDATHNTFVNTIQNYPYPYVINSNCWEFPCVVPSDWEAQHLQKPNNPDTLRDMKAALDITVLKQGVYCLVFHPHGWIRNDQVVELIDHAVAKHGRRVKFLNFREAYERLTKSASAQQMNDLVAQEQVRRLLPFNLPDEIAEISGTTPNPLSPSSGIHFVDLDEDGFDDIVFSDANRYGVWLFADMETGWTRKVLAGKRGENAKESELPPIVRADGSNNGFFVHSRHLFWQNEDTDKLPDLVDRRSFNNLLANTDLTPRPKSTVGALKSFQTRPGFKVELMAAEPLTMDPVAFEWGTDGKLWVVEMADYPLGIPPAAGTDAQETKPAGGGRVRFLEDADNDGQYDKSTLFLDGIPFPTGVLPWRNGVLITSAPDILYAEDTDGDGRADKRESLFTGFVQGNQQHRVNGLVYGLDNWVYCANGDSGGTIKSRKTGQEVSISGRDVRIRPDTGEVEPVSGQTQFGRNRDDWGNWFGCNNSNPMYQFALDEHYQRRNPHFASPNSRRDVPHVAGNAPVFPISRTLDRFNDIHTLNRFTSACSAMIYRDNLFGPHFAGNMFVSEPVHNLVHREQVTLQPSGLFTSERAPDEQDSEFLASTDNWFRPTMVKTGPDGALWIADMYRHVIEHPQWIPDTWQKRLDLRAGHDKGRIYRVFPVHVKPRPFQRLDTLRTPELVAALDSPSGWQRDTVQRLLIERCTSPDDGGKTANEIIPLLQKLIADNPTPLCRLHALCVLDGIQKLAVPVLHHALADKHPGVRRHAVRLSEPFVDSKSASPALPLVDSILALAGDSDPHVRMQLAYTFGEIADPRAALTLGNLLADAAGNQYLFAAAMSSIHKENVERALAAVLAQRGSETLQPQLIEGLLTMAASLGNEKALLTLLAEVTRPSSGKFERQQFAAMGSLLDALDRQDKSLAKLSEKPDAARQAALQQVAALFEAARSAANDPSSDDDRRAAAIRLLGRRTDAQNDRALLATLLSPQSPPAVQEAAVAALGRINSADSVNLLLENWRGFGAGRRGQVLDLMLSRETGIERLLTAVEQQQVSATDFDAARRQRLLDHKTPAVRNRADRLFAGTVNSDRLQVIERYRSALDTPGDMTRGAELFRTTCSPCHKLKDVGVEVGPDLASLSDKSPESLLIALLDPNRAVETKYINYTAVTNDGLTFNGLLAAETGNSITLRGPAAKEQTILRADLDELVSTSKSTMPEGLEKDLKPEDVAHVIAYVRANVPVPQRKEFPGNIPTLITAAADGAYLLPVTAAEIYGTTLVLEKQYNNLGWWSSLDDQAIWMVDVKRSGKYAIEFDYSCDQSVAEINPWRLDAGSATTSGKVPSTGNWDTYRQSRLGEIELNAGKQRLILRPAKRIQGAMLDLKSLRLVPQP